MNKTMIRPTAIAIAAATLLCGCQRRDYLDKAAQVQREQPAPGIVLAVGDSLTAGYGVKEEEAYPARLEKKLREAGHPWRVINAGVSGETSSEMLSRIDEVIGIKPRVVILETGANDGLEGVDPKLTQRNIEEITRILREHEITVLLAGMRLPDSLGRGHMERFAQIYPAVARKYELVLIPFFLAGVAGDPALNQRDGLHPTPEGYDIIAEMMYPYVLQAIGENTHGSGS